MYTEFFNTQPTDTRTLELPVRGSGPDVADSVAVDTYLNFGPMVMERGRAFTLGTGGETQEVPVRKTWEQVEGRTFLIERTAYVDLQPLLQELPEASAPTPEQRERAKRQRDTAAVNSERGTRKAELANATALARPGSFRLPPLAFRIQQWPRSPQDRLIALSEGSSAKPIAFRESSTPSVVLDWMIVNTTANMVFDGATAYYVTGPVNLSSSGSLSVVFNAGTVIKYAKTGAPSLNVVSGASLKWFGAPYRPVIFTSVDDNSVGETLPGVTGAPNGTYAATALSLNGGGFTSGLILSNLCVRHAAVGVSATQFGATAPLTIRHAQFVQCGTAMAFQLGSSTVNTYFPQNVLVVGDSGSGKVFGNLYYARIHAEYMTIHGANTLLHSTYNPHESAVTVATSILVSVINTAEVTLDRSGTPNCNPAFLAVGGGAYYFDRDNGCMAQWLSSYIGSTNDEGLKEDLKSMGVNPPSPIGGAITANTVLGRKVTPDDGAAIGYHYHRIDHFVSSPISVTGATLYLTNGVVLAGYTGPMITLNTGARLVSGGRPDSFNQLAWYSGVQESPGPAVGGSTRKLIELSTGAGSWPEIRMRFTRAGVCADSSGRRGFFTANSSSKNVAAIELRDCHFGGVVADFSPTSYGSQLLNLANNVWESATLGAYRSYAGLHQVYLRNNLFRRGALTLYYNHFEPYGNPVWICADNLFDTTSLAGLTVATNYLVAGWNGYTGGAFFGGLGNKTGLAPAYLSGPLGNYYYKEDPAMNSLRDEGARNANDAGLFHYTTTLDQVKEQTSRVDIGFHYVATAEVEVTQGETTITRILPVDSDADSLPDYFEDINGNGTAQTGETHWNSKDADGDFFKDPEERAYGSRGLDDEVDFDSDGDTIADYAEVVDGTDPSNPVDSSPRLLGEWRFNVAGLVNQQGAEPLNCANAPRVSSYEGMAVTFGATVSATNVLRYPISESLAGGATRISLNLRWGSVRFTYSPHWLIGSTTGSPNAWCRLLECGLWRLSVTPDGQYLVFETPAADGSVTRNMTVALPRPVLANGERMAWEIDVQYCPARTWISINGSRASDIYSGGLSEGAGITAEPTPAQVASGFVIGSTLTGSLGAQGYIDQLFTFNSIFAYRHYSSPEAPKEGATAFGRMWDFAAGRGAFLGAAHESDGLRLRWVRGWEGDPGHSNNANNYRLQRRVAGQSTWSTLTTGLLTTDTWKDTTVSAGVTYDYQLTRASGKPLPTTTAAWQAPAVETRGRALLIVDGTLASSLTLELNRFTQDLIGDGWTVESKTDAPRHNNDFWASTAINTTYNANLTTVKNWIISQWQPSVPNVIIIVGHVTVPYSGVNQAEDGHPVTEHAGAWAADSWYGDVDAIDAIWGDSAPAALAPPNPIHDNSPGDKKWEAGNRPANVTFEIPVGRIDFNNLPTFGSLLSDQAREVMLLKRYFDKNYSYRRGGLNFDASLRTWINSDSFSKIMAEAHTATSGLFGTDLTVQHKGDAFRLSSTSRPSTLWAFHGGSGQFNSVQSSINPDSGSPGEVHRSQDLANLIKYGDFGFAILGGSYFANWNHSGSFNGGLAQNNLLRSCLAQTTHGLAVIWDYENTHGGQWRFGPQALGEPIASALKSVLNDPVAASVRTTFILGDPTLRLLTVKPVSGLNVTGTNPKTLTWTASTTPGAGYWVYATTTSDMSSWTRLTQGAPQTATNYPHSNPTGVTYYMVRAVALQSGGSGSFHNLSVGTIKAP